MQQNKFHNQTACVFRNFYSFAVKYLKKFRFLEINLKNTDKIICATLQLNARTPLTSLAEKTGLSVASVSEHVKKLEEQHIIQGYYTKLDHKALGFDITAFVFVAVESSTYYEGFIAQCRMIPEIMECHAITGIGSHILKIRTINTSELERLLAMVQRIEGVKNTTTNIVLSSHIESMALHLTTHQ